MAIEDIANAEVERTCKLEEVCGGPDRAFRMMRLWSSAHRAASGNRFTLSNIHHVDPVAMFRNLAKQERFSEEAIRVWLEETD